MPDTSYDHDYENDYDDHDYEDDYDDHDYDDHDQEVEDWLSIFLWS